MFNFVPRATGTAPAELKRLFSGLSSAKIAAAVMATGLCSKVSASPDEYVKNYYLILEKMQQDEGAAQQRRWSASKGPTR